jgi:hypothetical protein
MPANAIAISNRKTGGGAMDPGKVTSAIDGSFSKVLARGCAYSLRLAMRGRPVADNHGLCMDRGKALGCTLAGLQIRLRALCNKSQENKRRGARPWDSGRASC